MSLLDPESLPYRPNVALAIMNPKGQLLMAKRIHSRQNIWQCPQGGVEPGETIQEAAWREMAEEVGTKQCKYLGELEGTFYYDLPIALIGRALGGNYRGQEQTWAVFEFIGEDKDINLQATNHPEFSEWAWVDLSQVKNYPLGFKGDVYDEAIPKLTAFWYNYIHLARNS